MDPWERRAFLAGAACLPADEQRHWYASVRPQLDDLERAVVDWARAVPQGTRHAAPPRQDDEDTADDVAAPDWIQDEDIPF
jgi:hypothetical protein